MTSLAADVAVIGAGPAGSVFAIRMAQLGFDVCLVERARFPRSHLGESLTPGVMPMLASVGAAAAIDGARFPRVHTVSTNWDGSQSVREDPHAQGMLVDRGVFDTLLLECARALGVRVVQPAFLRHHAPTPEGWLLQLDADGEAITLRTRFLADASGRSARLGGERQGMGLRTVAIYGYWTGSRLPEQPRIEAGEREWYWGVPIPDGSYNTLVFIDAERFRAERGRSLDERLRALLRRSALMDGVRDARLRGDVRAADATPYVREVCVSEHEIRLGDAALALDPLSSSGVQKAIQTALSGAIVANTLLRRPHDAEAAIRFYHDSVHDAADRHRRWAASHYATAAVRLRDPFWTNRAGAAVPFSPDSSASTVPSDARIADDVPVQLSADSRWEKLPCLGAHYVEMKLALRHPQLDGPVAYVGGHSLASLLRDVRPGLTSRQLAAAWSATVPLSTGLAIARWLTGHGVLEPCVARLRGHPGLVMEPVSPQTHG